MTKSEENKIREIMNSYRSEPMRGTNIQGYSVYAMENAMQQAFTLGKETAIAEYNEQFKEIEKTK